jgi:hypothetical protein
MGLIKLCGVGLLVPARSRYCVVAPSFRAQVSARVCWRVCGQAATHFLLSSKVPTISCSQHSGARGGTDASVR